MEEIRKNKFSRWNKINYELINFIYNKKSNWNFFFNSKKLFYKASSTETLLKAWIQLKSDSRVFIYDFEIKILCKISKQWFKQTSDKLKKGSIIYFKFKCVKIPNLVKSLNTKFLFVSNPKIKIVETAFLRFLEPQFESNNFNTKLNTCACFALSKVKHWKINAMYFIVFSVKKSFNVIHRSKLKNLFKTVIFDKRFWFEIQKMFNVGYLKKNLKYCKSFRLVKNSLLFSFLFQIYMHVFDTFVNLLKQTKIKKCTNMKMNKTLYFKRKACTFLKINFRQESVIQWKIDFIKCFKKHKPRQKKIFCNFISYTRYISNCLIGVSSFKKHAFQVKQQITNFVNSNLCLDISKNKLISRNRNTLIFLGHFVKFVCLVRGKFTQNRYISFLKRENRTFNQIKMYKKKLIKIVFFRTKNKILKLINSVSKLLSLKFTSEQNIEATVFSTVIKYLEKIRNKIFTIKTYNNKVLNLTTIKLYKNNTNKIELKEQLLKIAGKVKVQTKKSSEVNLTKKIKEILINFRKNVKKIENQWKQKKLLIVNSTGTKTDLIKIKLLKIQVNANVKKIINKLRITGYFDVIKNKPISNFSLTNFLDLEIIKSYNIIIYGLLNWFFKSDNFYIIKEIVESLRKSCALTLKLKHKYKYLRQVHLIYSSNIKTNEVKLYSKIEILSWKKKYNVSKNQNKINYNYLQYFVKTIKL